jgi:DNA (cytosine-5)-methyltransferase 1
MIYGSVCSEIEAATVAWKPLGWTPAWYSEIDPFAKSVLKYHYPNTPNLGNMKTLYEHEIFNNTQLDLLVGGTPCQSFSQAGYRHGLADPNGDLALQFIRLVSVCQPEYFLWENVPGVLSIDQGRAFQQIANEIRKCGYGFAYRVLDASYFGVPQRRRRVYLVGHQDYRCAAQVLFESEVSQWNNKTKPNKKSSADITAPCFADVYHFSLNQNTAVTFGVTSGGSSTIGPRIIDTAPCFADVYNHRVTGDIAATFGSNSGGTNTAGPKIIDPIGIRRVMPIEAERLMGFPDDYTKLDGCTDSQRYKALGNSMVIPVMSWLGQRIHQMCQCRDKTPAILPVLSIRAAVSLGGDAVGTLQ